MKYFLAALAMVVSFSSQAGQVSVVQEGKTAGLEDYLSYNFGTVWTHSRSFVRYTVTNTGTTPLTYQNAVIYGADFSARHSCQNGLLPNQRCSFEIEYWPMFEGHSSGRFVLNFVEDQIVVDLWGQARRM